VVDCITRNLSDEGQADVAFVPGVGHKPALKAERIELRTGGDAANEAFVLATLGKRADLMCVLGSDLAGDIVFSEAVKRGVGTGRITRSETLNTPVADIIVNPDGSRYSVSSNAAKLAGYIPDPALINGARILSLASIFRAPLDDPEVILDIVKAARSEGMVVCADTKLPTFRKNTLSEMEDIFPMVDYIFPNEAEAGYYTGAEKMDEMADILLRMGVKNVVIKAGAQGCFAANASGAFMIPAAPAEVVDTTGAGDNFVAGFICGILEGNDLRECCVRGTEQAAKSLGHTGAV